jgi:hypothetical protein
MSRVDTIAFVVRNVARDDPGALNVSMQDWTWRPRWLEPMKLLQIAQPDFGCPAPVPVPVHPNEHVLDRHGSFLDVLSQSTGATMCAPSR